MTGIETSDSSGRKAAVPHALHYGPFTRAPTQKVGGQWPPTSLRVRRTLF